MHILITGASRGIGLATAKLLDTKHNNLYLAASSKDSFKETFQNAQLFATDLTDPHGPATLAEEVLKQTGTLDVLINMAGVMIMKKFEEMPAEDINTLLDLNLRSHLLLTRALLPAVQKSEHGQIVFMSSMAAKSSIVGESVYAATKSGITGFANVLRNEVSPQVRVSAVHAWGVDTWGSPNPAEFIQPADVAAAIEFIITRPLTAVVESIELGNPAQWRGGQAPWSPK